MDLDWYSEDDFKNTSKFNENSVISKEKKKIINTEESEPIKNNIVIKTCFDMNLNITSNKDLSNIIHYTSSIADHLRKLIRNKTSKFNNFTEITQEEFESICNYLNWLKLASGKIKNFFVISLRKDNSYDPNTIKLFKTSSYKFCNFKESCSIHKNKQSKCDKNHFVFDMIINDIAKLIESINTVGLKNINLILSNNVVKITYDSNSKLYEIEKINPFLNNNLELNENQYVIDKTLIFKSFDVISYVLNKMYEESFYFLCHDNNSLVINTNF